MNARRLLLMTVMAVSIVMAGCAGPNRGYSSTASVSSHPQGVFPATNPNSD